MKRPSKRSLNKRAAVLVAICAMALAAPMVAGATSGAPNSCAVPGSGNGLGDTLALYTRVTCG